MLDTALRESSNLVSQECLSLGSGLDNKDGRKVDQLRFPLFPAETLQQTWIDPADSLGKIRLLIAEGIRSTTTSAFEKIRNVVLFSFHHAPKGWFTLSQE